MLPSIGVASRTYMMDCSVDITTALKAEFRALGIYELVVENLSIRGFTLGNSNHLL